MNLENPKKKKKKKNQKSKETPLTHNWFCQANHNNNDKTLREVVCKKGERSNKKEQRLKRSNKVSRQ